MRNFKEELSLYDLYTSHDNLHDLVGITIYRITLTNLRSTMNTNIKNTIWSRIRINLGKLNYEKY